MYKCKCGREFEKGKSYASHCRSCRIHLGREPAPNIGFLEYNKVAWNKGLTKETDERVRKNGEKISKSLKGKLGHPQSEDTRKLLSEIMKEKAKKGELKGFMKRGKESYPEKFWRQVLDNNSIDYIQEYRVSFSSLGISDKPSAGYFLDFYLTEIKVDLEIDGSQHKWGSVREKDIVRDHRLRNSGYEVYRIPYIDPSNSELVKSQIDSFLEFYYNKLSEITPH